MSCRQSVVSVFFSDFTLLILFQNTLFFVISLYLSFFPFNSILFVFIVNNLHVIHFVRLFACGYSCHSFFFLLFLSFFSISMQIRIKENRKICVYCLFVINLLKTSAKHDEQQKQKHNRQLQSQPHNNKYHRQTISESSSNSSPSSCCANMFKEIYGNVSNKPINIQIITIAIFHFFRL